jgi:short subunit fatty acids transporter
MIRRLEGLSLPFVLVLTFTLLTAGQWFVDSANFAKLTILALGMCFAAKSWVFFVGAYTMYREQGTSRLAVTCKAFFWALLSFALPMALLMFLGYLDAIGRHVPYTELDDFRNTVRNIVITAAVGIMVCGSRLVDAIFEYLRDRRYGQDARDVSQDMRETAQNKRDADWGRR